MLPQRRVETSYLNSKGHAISHELWEEAPSEHLISYCGVLYNLYMPWLYYEFNKRDIGGGLYVNNIRTIHSTKTRLQSLRHSFYAPPLSNIDSQSQPCYLNQAPGSHFEWGFEDHYEYFWSSDFTRDYEHHFVGHPLVKWLGRTRWHKLSSFRPSIDYILRTWEQTPEEAIIKHLTDRHTSPRNYFSPALITLALEAKND